MSASGVLRSAFNRARCYFTKEKRDASLITASILLGGTALGTALLGTTFGAAAGFAAGCYLLSRTCDVLIDNSKQMGARIGVSPLLLGTLLGCATSAPELAVSAGSVLQGAADMAIGNISGSNIGNIGLILGLTAMIKPLPSKTGVSWSFNTKAMAATTALFGAQLFMGGSLMPVMGPAMIAGLAYYLHKSYRLQDHDAKTHPEQAAANTEPITDTSTNAQNMAWGAAALAGLVFSASLFVSSATLLATGLGVSPALIGAFAVALGTSMPEMVLNIKSALRGDTDVALGNILGSNVFNVLMVGGVVALAGTPVSPEFSGGNALGVLNLGAFLASGLLLAKSLLDNNGAISRKMGATMVAAYSAFAFASYKFADAPPPVPDAPAVSAPVAAPSLPRPVFSAP